MGTTADTTQPIMNTYGRFPITVTKGKGSYVWDDKGTKYLDFTSGIATCNLGHVPEFVKNALVNQLDQLWHVSNLYHIEPQQKLAKQLTKVTSFDQVFFCNSGAEANEAAIKLVRAKANSENKQPLIVTFKKSFHGRTLATLTATGQEKIQTGFSPLVEGFHYLPFNDEDALEKLNEWQPTAVMLELVQGEGGVVPAHKTWIKKLVEICKKNNSLIVVDEVQTGIGRTGTLFAYQQYDLEPDIMTIAKGLGSGFPIGAMLAKEHVSYLFGPGSHGSTFGGNPLATTAGLSTIQYILNNELLTTISDRSKQLTLLLQKIASQYDFIEEVRGKGLLIGLKLNREIASTVVLESIKNELLILTAGPDVIRLLPPLTVSEEEILLFVEKFEKALKAAKEC